MKRIIVLFLFILLCSGCKTNGGGFSDYIPWWADNENITTNNVSQ